MTTQPESSETFASWLLTRLQADLAPVEGASPLPVFLKRLYEDMRSNPDAYFIPREVYVEFSNAMHLSAEEERQHEALKTARLRVRKAVYAYLDFLYELGLACSLEEGQAVLARSTFEHLVQACAKKLKNRPFLAALGRSGLRFSQGELVEVSCQDQPGLPAALAAFSQACARSKEFSRYLFRRADLAVFTEKTAPEFGDALNRVPAPYQADVAATDQRLLQLRYRREIFIDDGDASYRIRYSKNGALAVYWCRVQEIFNPALCHYLRWDLASPVSPCLFARLNQTQPGLGDLVFAELKPCEHCYGENCMDRKTVAWAGQTRQVCQGSGWSQISHSPQDYQRLWQVLAALEGCLKPAPLTIY